MPFTFCFKSPNGAMRCVDIPVLVNQFPPVGPDPDPGKWLLGKDLRPELGRDLLTLGRMRALSASLSPEMRPAFDAGFERAAEAMRAQLPADVTIELSRTPVGAR
jgi:hypothetical protein